MSRVEPLLARVRIVLVRPKYPENIGAAARAALTMGVGGLVVVGPPLTDPEPAMKTATHNAAHLLREIAWRDSVEEALAEYALVVGTTARQGRQRMALAAPAELAELILPALEQGPVALLFGPEDKGLANQELTHCGAVMTIPTAPQFSSLNLAQAVAITCHELRQGLLRLVAQAPQRLQRPRTANPEEIKAMITAATQASQALDQASGQQQTAIRLRHLRRAITPYGLSAREAKLLKDACHQVVKVVAKLDRQ
jgi:tRNA/rRNA methyltransferase